MIPAAYVQEYSSHAPYPNAIQVEPDLIIGRASLKLKIAINTREQQSLLQRRKNRDLFDMNEGLSQIPMDPSKLLASFVHYLWIEGKSITRATADQRMLEKLQKSLTEDIAPLLPAGITFTEDEAIAAFGRIWFKLITEMAGEPWKLSQEVIEELRKEKMPNLLL